MLTMNQQFLNKMLPQQKMINIDSEGENGSSNNVLNEFFHM